MVAGRTILGGKAHVTNQSVTVPRTVDVDKAHVSTQDGLVTVTLPKKTVSEPTRIAIDTSEALPISGKSAYTLQLLAPGLAAADLTVMREDDLLKLSGETARTGARLERSYRLPRDADTLNTRVSHVDGMLTIMIPKEEMVAVRRLPLSVTADEADTAQTAMAPVTEH